MSSRSDLRLEWCSREAANYAVKHWHYSRSMPAGKVVTVGVWESGKYIGAVIFSRGSNKAIGQKFGLGQTECVELARVALTKHETPVSRIVAIACRMLKRQSPGLRCVVSFADPHEGHVGAIYQAGNWSYVGEGGTADGRVRPYAKGGRIYHWRSVARWLVAHGYSGTVKGAEEHGFTPLEHIPKHKYLMPLDDAMRAQIEPLRKPYPKRPKQATTSAQEASGGAAPTRTLQTSEATLVP
jgi:hypothetical protein